ncbi:NAD-dependent epimerase/dehydratase family protein [Kocuria sp. ZOR0020]|uniref:NAD-dependent epimerase/dehydratase family protein n=1 Tax=Kocuria sp. ZOR0020 TaxID=1339234 RepID=UPI0006486258|nr:NAD-dependent epimerase/dehydratase family protein [Kocuria sp. ZOR0020]
MKYVGVVGAGAIGRLTAAELVRRGHRVTMISRSGHQASPDQWGAWAVDARNGHEFARALKRDMGLCDVVVNAVNPVSYTRWERDWPPMAQGIADACATLGAGHLMVGNLYGYGSVSGSIAETRQMDPYGVKGRVRARMWVDALRDHRAGGAPAVEVRASDYFGAAARPGVSLLMDYVIRPVLRGTTAWVPVGDLDAEHSWTYLPDIARLVADLVESDTGGHRWGRAWHVPTSAPRAMRAVAQDTARLMGERAGVVRRVPRAIMAAARIHPLVRALDETRHQFESPWMLDSTAAQVEFGWSPTPWEEALGRTVRELTAGQ